MNLIQYMRNSESDGGRSGYTFSGSPTSIEELSRERGFTPASSGAGFRGTSQQYQEARAWTEATLARAIKGDRWASLRLREALTTSDFGTLFGDVIDRSILANYAETPYSWSAYCKRATIQDFRLAKIFRVDRGAAVLDGPILPNSYSATGSGSTGLEQVSEYPMRKRVATDYTDQLYKFGARMDFAWETLINDDLDALKDTPALFGRAARRTEEERATKLYVSSTGPNTTFFSNTNKNLLNATNLTTLLTYYGLNNNPPLSITALQAAMVLMMQQRDLDGEPISIEGVTLVVPPALKITAMSIVNATQVWMNDTGGTYATPNSNSAISLQRLITENWAKGIVKIAVDYYLPVVDTTHGLTGWYLFADPNLGRPALQQSFLRGHEMPEIFMKLPNAVAIGEGTMGPGMGAMPGTTMANPMEGDFESDTIAYKIRHVLGGTLLDPIMAVASSGANA
jgi:hypothetical protein